MIRMTELIGMRVVSQSSGRYLAMIHDLIVDRATRQVAALLVEADEGYGLCRALPWSAIRNTGDVMLVEGRNPLVAIRDDAYLLRLMRQYTPLLRLPVTAPGSRLLGLCYDVFIDWAGDLLGFKVGAGFWSLTRSRLLASDDVLALSRDAIMSRTADLPPLTAIEGLKGLPQRPAEVLEQPLLLRRPRILERVVRE